MQKEKGLVSIITPVYNTGVLLTETVESVLSQEYTNFELLLIDDGSTDATIQKLPDYKDSRISIITQVNQGMARTRNNGLRLAKGEFVLFLDHDDLIEKDFLQARIDFLNNHPEVGFVGGPIKTFPDNPQDFVSAAVNIEEEVLFFKPQFLTTPSSYVIRRSVLEKNDIFFNERLSSTADRFMLLKLGKVTKGARVNTGRLLYRISVGGFSQNIKPGLIHDNEMLYAEMKRHELVPQNKKSKFRSLYFFMLAGGYKKVGYKGKTIQFLFRSFLSNPGSFVRRILSKTNT